jgi:hypothetical protein
MRSSTGPDTGFRVKNARINTIIRRIIIIKPLSQE